MRGRRKPTQVNNHGRGKMTSSTISPQRIASTIRLSLHFGVTYLKLVNNLLAQLLEGLDVLVCCGARSCHQSNKEAHAAKVQVAQLVAGNKRDCQTAPAARVEPRKGTATMFPSIYGRSRKRRPVI